MSDSIRQSPWYKTTHEILPTPKPEKQIIEVDMESLLKKVKEGKKLALQPLAKHGGNRKDNYQVGNTHLISKTVNHKLQRLKRDRPDLVIIYYLAS